MLFHRTPTPCVGICSTTYGDTVCRGCRRYLHEVIDWNRYGEDEKRAIWRRLDSLQAQILPNHFLIAAADRLRAQLRHYRIPHRAEADDWGCLYALLKATARQAPDLAEFGVIRLDRSRKTLEQLRDQINGELHTLAAAYYERDLLRAQQGVGAASDPRADGAPERT